MRKLMQNKNACYFSLRKQHDEKIYYSIILMSKKIKNIVLTHDVLYLYIQLSKG